jgi:hypothetical protein
MAVFHILKNGTQVDDIAGHVVRHDDVASIYELLKAITKEAKT